MYEIWERICLSRWWKKIFKCLSSLTQPHISSKADETWVNIPFVFEDLYEWAYFMYLSRLIVVQVLSNQTQKHSQLRFTWWSLVSNSAISAEAQDCDTCLWIDSSDSICFAMPQGNFFFHLGIGEIIKRIVCDVLKQNMNCLWMDLLNN